MVNYVLKMCIMICAVQHALAGNEMNWCKLVCPQNKRRSTMCEHDHQSFTDDCGDFKHDMTPNKRKHILHLHNDYRNKMAEGTMNKSWPKSSNMRQLGWDVVLEAVAIRWSEQCIDDNDLCPITPDFWYVGQNSGMFSYTGEQQHFNGTVAFRAWSREIENVKSKPETLINRFQDPATIGHFTQLIWADTHKIGCADIMFKRNGWYHAYFFCNYGIGGNFINEQIYRVGKPCSECEHGTACKSDSRYPSLCALSEDAKQPVDIEGPSDELIESSGIYSESDAQKPSISAALSIIVFFKLRFG